MSQQSSFCKGQLKLYTIYSKLFIKVMLMFMMYSTCMTMMYRKKNRKRFWPDVLISGIISHKPRTSVLKGQKINTRTQHCQPACLCFCGAFDQQFFGPSLSCWPVDHVLHLRLFGLVTGWPGSRQPEPHPLIATVFS